MQEKEYYQQELVKKLIERGKQVIDGPETEITFAPNEGAKRILEDIDTYPHIFLLGCLMDRQIKAEKAWLIPYHISTRIGGTDFEYFVKTSLEEYKELFNTFKYHRFNTIMAEYTFLAVQKIHEDYNDDASMIWRNAQSSATVIRRFLEFKGIGVKIATMAVNLLVRERKKPISDLSHIDISSDTHVRRVFKRTGLVSPNPSNEEVIYRAKELYPSYPGILDIGAFEVGRQYCFARKKPDCDSCYLGEYCEKNIK